ncbi:MAG: CsbD family protein [Pseudomonadota bacterium]
MNWDQVEGKWTELKGKAQQKWGKLTDDDLDVVKGKREELAGKIQARYGKTKEEAEKEVDAWLESC